MSAGAMLVIEELVKTTLVLSAAVKWMRVGRLPVAVTWALVIVPAMALRLPLLVGASEATLKVSLPPLPSTLVVLPARVLWMLKTSAPLLDRQSTRLNSSDPSMSYAVVCWKKMSAGARPVIEVLVWTTFVLLVPLRSLAIRRLHSFLHDALPILPAMALRLPLLVGASEATLKVSLPPLPSTLVVLPARVLWMLKTSAPL